ncbi:MAG: glycosyltransferase [Candidatus Helarchaeota archaeon]
MGKIWYLIYGLIISIIFAIIHLIFPPEWSIWIRKSNEMFLGVRPQFLGLYILGCFFFILFPILHGIGFFASFGKVRYPEGSENFFPPISVIVPALNEEQIIRGTLDSYVKSEYPKDKCEFILVTSGSTDRTTEICQKYQDRLNIKVVTEPLSKKGKPAALNMGLRHASNDIICVFDSDAHLQEDTLQYLVRQFYNPTVDAAIGFVEIRNWKVNKLTKAIATEFCFMVGAGLYHEIRARLGRRLWIFGRNYAIRKTVLEEIGGWNEDALTEDLHLSVQLWMLNKKIVHTPDAIASEQAPTDWVTFKKQRQRWVGGYKQGLNEAMELDKRAVILRNFGMLHYGHINNFALVALIPACIFGFIVKDFYITLLCLTEFFFTFGMGVISIKKYHGRYRFLLYYPVFFVTNFYMFAVQFVKIKMTEWEKTEKE